MRKGGGERGVAEAHVVRAAVAGRRAVVVLGRVLLAVAAGAVLLYALLPPLKPLSGSGVGGSFAGG